MKNECFDIPDKRRMCVKNRVREYRKERKMTQDDLAKQVDVTRQTIVSLESGKYVASLQLAFKLSRYFGVTIEDLFEFDDE